MGLSLWLVPSSAAQEPLRSVISNLAEHAQSPRFGPHITLASLPAETATPLASFALPEPFRVSFKAVRSGETYFQSVLIAIEPTPALLALRDAAVAAFDRPKQSYFPHLSLFYGELPLQAKEAIIEELKEDGVIANTSTGVSVGGVESVEISELWIVLTEGPVENWKVLEKRIFK